MLLRIFSVCFLFSLVYCVAYKPEKIRVPPKYVIDLDKQPQERWTKVLQDYRTILIELSNLMKKFLPAFLEPMVEKIAADLDHRFMAPFPEELRGMAKTLNISLTTALIVNIWYDMTTACTSLLTRDNNGMIWHARNLDLDFDPVLRDLLMNATVFVDFQRNGKTVYNGVTFPGYLGMITAQKPHVFTVTVDTRYDDHYNMNLVMAILDHKLLPMSFIVRDVLETAQTYREAVDQLAYRVTAAPVYYIVGGLKGEEGVVISKGRFTTADFFKLKPAPGRWYVVETNSDHWAKTPIDPRRKTAIREVKAMGQNITRNALLKVISTPPVLNDITIYQIVMSAAKPDDLYVRMSPYHRPHHTSPLTYHPSQQHKVPHKSDTVLRFERP